ncbi:MAG: hypothetical protein ACKO3B_13405 [Bacteroidota bacterium]
MGLEDDFTLRIRAFHPEEFPGLEEWYEILSAIYRFRLGTNQLEFLWDGSDHFSRYSADWGACFRSWVGEFCQDQVFVQAVLDLTVFLPQDAASGLTSSRMHHFMLNRLGVRLHRTKGLVAA